MTHWTDVIRDQLTAICDRYRTLAPTVSVWADDLYIRMNEKPETVVMSELLAVDHLKDGCGWMHGNVAANYVYKLLHRLGRDVSGQAGF